MAHAFYPFVENGEKEPQNEKGGEPEKDEHPLGNVRYPARIAVYDDAAAAPRVVVIEPSDIRSYLEEITATVNKLAREQGGQIPFTVIREIVENFIHAYFIAPTITILDGGNTLRFSDQGPGIREKDVALEYGTTSATEEMKHYIRGVGSGLPYVQQYMVDKGGSLSIEDNIAGGTVVTISTRSTARALELTRAAKAPTVDRDAQTRRDSGSEQLKDIRMSKRGELILSYLSEHELVGPSDLRRDYGYSLSTWSRELSALVQTGLLKKAGQKYQLTRVGKSFI